jgi:two-component system KDP operon response regulator KdpE
MTRILLVDDEQQFRETLVKALKQHGHRVTDIATPELLASTLAIQRPDVILLDLNFDAEVNGLEACENLRRWNTVPVVVVSADSEESTKVKALKLGADDYLVKPFGIMELLARIEAIQRRLMPRYHTPQPIVQINDLMINLHTSSVLLGGKVLDLTRKEYQLLELLALAEGELVTYNLITTTIWPGEVLDTTRSATIRSLVKRLRQKLNDDLADPAYIVTQSGMGFRLNTQALVRNASGRTSDGYSD